MATIRNAFLNMEIGPSNAKWAAFTCKWGKRYQEKSARVCPTLSSSVLLINLKDFKSCAHSLLLSLAIAGYHSPPYTSRITNLITEDGHVVYVTPHVMLLSPVHRIFTRVSGSSVLPPWVQQAVRSSVPCSLHVIVGFSSLRGLAAHPPLHPPGWACLSLIVCVVYYNRHNSTCSWSDLHLLGLWGIGGRGAKFWVSLKPPVVQTKFLTNPHSWSFTLWPSKSAS